MLISHGVPHTNGSLYIPARVREWLQLPRNCRLFCRLVDDTGDPFLVVSPIPTEHWDNCFRISVNTDHHPGSVHAVLLSLEQCELNILHMIASATSSSGEMAVTAIVTPGDSRHDLPEETARRLSEKLCSSPALNGVLSRSALFAPANKEFAIRPIRVEPLVVLRSLKLVQPRTDGLGRLLRGKYSPEFVYDLKNSRINLAEHLIAANPVNSGEALAPFYCMERNPMKPSITALLTSDVNECHIRLCLLPEANFVAVTVPVQVSVSDPNQFRGLTRHIVGAFAAAPTQANIYHVSNFTASNPLRGSDGSLTEVADIKIVADARWVYTTPHKSIRRQVIAAIDRSLQSAQTEDRKVALRKPISVRPLLAPLVFTATNVKRTMDAEYKRMAIELFAELKDLHLRPVFLDTLGGRSSAREQMARLLDACPLLVSLYLPEPGNELKTPNPQSPSITCAASVWTAFEEAYMSAKRDRPIYRLIHRNVFPPPFVDRALEYTFSNYQEFRAGLSEIRRRIKADQVRPEWPDWLRICSEAFEHGRVTPEEVAQRDPELWLTENPDFSDFPEGTGLPTS